MTGRNVVDSSGWLEYLADSPQAVHFEQALQDTENLIVPVITIYEVFKKVLRERGEGDALLVASQMQSGTVIDLDPTLALEAARASEPKFSNDQVVGIGMDGTGSSPLPVDATNSPLASDSKFSENLNAQCWLWKDHTSIPEAGAITEIAAKLRPQYLAKIGGTYSSEWFWAKIWHCLKVDAAVFDAA